MAKDLTILQLDRQNILNNDLVVYEIQKQTGFQGILFEGRIRFTKFMVTTYFDVDIRTVERYVSENSDKYVVMDTKFLKVRDLRNL